MNKNDLVEQIAERSGLSKGQASEALGATISAIEDGLAAGQEIAI
ncbi:MAG: HU family DNA-binding protein, partial [Candidatus Limnocylindrales bacterium]